VGFGVSGDEKSSIDRVKSNMATSSGENRW
jgi:hypothetical protein